MNTTPQLKAISLWQPWASLWVAQMKINETRSWATSYKGPLAVHAARYESAELKLMCNEEPFKTALRELGFTSFLQLPRGCIIGICDGVECFSTTTAWRDQTKLEIVFGDWSHGRHYWHPKNMRMLKEPLRCMGAQSIWNVPTEIAEQVYAQLQIA